MPDALSHEGRVSDTLIEVVKAASKHLQDVAQRPIHEAQILLAHHLKKERLWVLANPHVCLEQLEPFWEMVRRRAGHEPIEYITSKVSFYSQEFYCAPGALIARPETELLIDAVLAHLKPDFSGHIVEIGVGSGIISIVLAQHLPQARFSAVDISPQALEVARINLMRFELEKRITLYEGSLLDPIREPIDAVVSNPPYIQEGVILDRTLAFEPQNALFGGSQGDELLRAIIDEVNVRKIPFLACEMGFDQKAAIENYVTITTQMNPLFYKDLAGLDRGFVLRSMDA